MATPAECLHNLPFTFSCQKKLPSVKYQGHTDHCDMTFDLVNPIYGSFFLIKWRKHETVCLTGFSLLKQLTRLKQD